MTLMAACTADHVVESISCKGKVMAFRWLQMFSLNIGMGKSNRHSY